MLESYWLLCNKTFQFLKDDVAVHKEILRLLDKMLQTAPKTSCQFTYLARWLVCVVNLTVSKLQVVSFCVNLTVSKLQVVSAVIVMNLSIVY